jgi:toxin ParE1/3/4
MATFKLNEEAEDDLERLYEHGILFFGLTQADRYYDGLIEHFYELAENPYLWQAVDSIRIGYRRSVYVSDSIYYRIDGDTVEVMRILGSQDPKKELE